MVKKDSPLGLYIHIPFCHARCGYCDFVTFTGQEDQRDRYIAALSQEIALYSACDPVLKSRSISTIFIGGGTPSVLESRHIETLFTAVRQQFHLDPDVEITLEANPESVSPDRLSAWREVGINRLSLGLQAYDDVVLKAIGRLHDVNQFEKAYALVRQFGFGNVNVDLMYGFQGQTLASWQKTLLSVTALKPEHLSVYALTVEEHTPFGAAGVIADADLQADMYAEARGYLSTAGFTQYEISNFSRPGYECRHNLIYWRAQDYLGVGVGAVGCQDGVRWQNERNFLPYFRHIAAGQRPRKAEEELDGPTRRFERLMLGLRLREGLKWDAEFDARWLDARARLSAAGCLEELPDNRWRIADRYVPLTNQVLMPFLSA